MCSDSTVMLYRTTMSLSFFKLEPRHLKEIYEIRFSVTENRLHAHQIHYLQREQALEDICQGGGWICQVGDDYAGYGLGIYAPEPLIGGLFVKPEYQKQGIGTHLLNAIVQWFSDRGAETIMLTTDPGSNAEGFYQANGWVAESSDAFGQRVMRKRLPRG
ncbi:GNAT family N-acetyltransferase [Pantoea ananatis]|uniref:GNAT family N-acetyltransferase n=1 Tax=Pantoea ananas TaxID=553 RepID=UPI001B315ED8|nr:GNAT family N-acetyltransferase [Pantoea ananatis]